MANYTPYRATKDFHIGQLRLDVAQGDTLFLDGDSIQIEGKKHTLPLIEKAIQAGWLVPASANLSPESPPNLIPFAASEAKEADGKRPEVKKPHVWTQDWLNSSEGQTCKVCGVTLLAEGTLIRADRALGNGKQQLHYRDAHGVQFSSFTELSCPAYVGDAASAAVQTKEVVRNVSAQVIHVENRVETMEARLLRLEAENELLQQQLAERPLIDATHVAEALYALLEKKGAALGESGIKYLPLPSLDEVEQEIRVPVPVLRNKSE